MYECYLCHKPIDSVCCEFCDIKTHRDCDDKFDCRCYQKRMEKAKNLTVDELLDIIDGSGSDNMLYFHDKLEGFLRGDDIDKEHEVLDALIYVLEDREKERRDTSIQRNDDCIGCGKKGSAVLCDSCVKEYKERNKNAKS